MSSAYGHRLARMGQLVDGKPFASTYIEARWTPEKRYSWGAVTPAHWTPNCAGRNCPNKPLYASVYRYVTGRSGRVTDRNQYWCPKCAEAWAKRHKLEFTPPPTQEDSHAAQTG